MGKRKILPDDGPLFAFTPVREAAAVEETATLTVEERAASLGMTAVEQDGFCYLYPIGGGTFATRGGSWEDCFQRYYNTRKSHGGESCISSAGSSN